MAEVERWELRVGDAERQLVVDSLRIHLGAGRLDLDEFEERTAAALAARTVGELVPLTADLPRIRTARAGPPVRPRALRPGPAGTWDVLWRVHVGLWPVLSILWIGIWAATALGDGSNLFWPVYPILGFGVSVGVHGVLRTAVRG